MLGRILKPFFPRGLYWRAALIVFLPVVTIMLVLSVAFIQRHYDGVTRQMTGHFVLMARHITAEIERAEDPAAAALRLSQALAMDITLVPQEPLQGQRVVTAWYDISGRLAIRELARDLPDMLGVELQRSIVTLWLPNGEAVAQLQFPLSRISARNPHQLLVLVFAIGVVMSLISFIYLKNQMRPIRHLAAAAEAFGRGQLMPLRVGGALEVRAASHAFLQMRERIERHIDQRTLLLSGVSHDLRTPLTRMRLSLSMLEDDPEIAALLSDVAEMEALIDRFLEFARTEVVEPVEVADLGALVSQRAAEARRGGQAVELMGPYSGPLVSLRPQMFARAFDNVISNALRYGSRARVSLEVGPRFVTVNVEDDGPGISPAQYELATRPFVRLDPARGASRGSGVGLGLAIVADAMRSHGGRLELDRGVDPEFGGLIARLILPLGPDSRA
ncbi:ATP-binding protein [Pararhodobacter oceanensis]|uniref:ATP-binding protein n=1 Tax=Pararhodobacter oceanensis TaxID=2172121 RepID=UPI003A90D4B0